jgi:hypothetical protein
MGEAQQEASRPLISLVTDLKADLTAQERKSSSVQSIGLNEVKPS